MKLFSFIPIALFIILALILAIALQEDYKNPRISHMVNQNIPEFSLPSLYDSTPLTSEQLNGQFTLLNVFASWCIPCRIEHPLLMELKESKQITIFGIAWKDREDKLQQWLKKDGNPYHKIGKDDNGKVIVQLGVTGAPETFLISPEGKILYRYAGPLNKAIFTEEILPLTQQ